ncbi:MAG: ketopantoate reductase family protein [Betaproteobacteria bacterium]
MKILVMGAGGVGGYFGARLQQAGNDVAFVARGRHLAAIRKDKLRIKSPLGDAALEVRAFEDPAAAGIVDVVLFTVKLWDTESAGARLRPALGPSTVVIPFQNGVESIELLKRVLPEQAVMGGAAYIAARIAEPGLIVQTGEFARLRFGPVHPAQRPMAQAFLAACQAARLAAELSDDIVRVLWEKFVLLVGVSSATAAARAPLGVVRTDPDLRWLLESALRETWSVARQRGIGLPEDFVAKLLAQIDKLPADMKASMAQDLEAGGRLEAPWLCGAVARMSQAAGLDAPVNRAVYAALKPFVGGPARQAA